MYCTFLMHLSMLSHWGKGGEAAHRLGTFDRFSGNCYRILLKSSDLFDNPQMPCGEAFEQNNFIKVKMPGLYNAWPPPSAANH